MFMLRRAGNWKLVKRSVALYGMAQMELEIAKSLTIACSIVFTNVLLSKVSILVLLRERMILFLLPRTEHCERPTGRFNVNIIFRGY